MSRLIWRYFRCAFVYTSGSKKLPGKSDTLLVSLICHTFRPWWCGFQGQYLALKSWARHSPFVLQESGTNLFTTLTWTKAVGLAFALSLEVTGLIAAPSFWKRATKPSYYKHFVTPSSSVSLCLVNFRKSIYLCDWWVGIPCWARRGYPASFLLIRRLSPTQAEMKAPAGRQWLTSVIPATQEAEIRRIEAQNQPGQIVRETLSWKYPSQKRAGRVAQGVGPECKP
jgi:hypothetical protein